MVVTGRTAVGTGKHPSFDSLSKMLLAGTSVQRVRLAVAQSWGEVRTLHVGFLFGAMKIF